MIKKQSHNKVIDCATSDIAQSRCVQCPTLHTGFTVLEFLVVLAIIGILISVALTGIDLSRKRARDNDRVSGVQGLTLALQQYYDVCRQYPDDIFDLGSDNGCPSGSSITWESFVPDGVLPDAQYQYVGLATYGTSPRCVGYHLGVTLEQEGNKLLNSDDDGDSSSGPWCGGLVGFDGDPNPDDLYDVIVNANY